MTACTARRGGVPFVRTRRRGLRSMSGHPAYAWGNPPTPRRSSFPQRALCPAGGPIPKHAWGCAPRPPNAQAAAGYALKVPAAHFILDFAETKLKINLISVVASGATFALVGLTLRFAPGSPPRCGASSFPHKVLRPCGDPDYTGCTDASGVSGSSPSDFWLLFFTEK